MPLFNKQPIISVPNEYYELTPINKIGNIYMKMDDKYEVAGVKGGKARTANYLIKNAKGVVTAGARQSPQIGIVASIANELNIPCIVHTIKGKITPEVKIALDKGAILNVHEDTWHNSVIISRAKEDAVKRNWTNIPFGMECFEAVRQTALQVKNIPDKIKKIIIPIGSGMSVSGVLHGLKLFKKDIKVIGIRVGADPIIRLNKYAPSDWKNNLTIIKSSYDYHKRYDNNEYCGYILDPIYEAKCLPYIEDDILFWVVGCRKE